VAETKPEPAGDGRETGRCESCGRDGEELEPVHRVYVTPESWDTEGKEDVVD